MAGYDRFDRQIALLQTLRGKILAVRKELDASRDEYLRHIEKARSSGFMEDYTDSMKKLHAHFSKRVGLALSVLEINTKNIDRHISIVNAEKMDAQRSGDKFSS